jgi:hypothetical protein
MVMGMRTVLSTEAMTAVRRRSWTALSCQLMGILAVLAVGG